DVLFCDVFFDDEDFDDDDFDDVAFDDEPVFAPLDLLRRSTLCCNASIKSITSPSSSSLLSFYVVGQTASVSSLASISSRNCFWYSSPKASSSKSSERDSIRFLAISSSRLDTSVVVSRTSNLGSRTSSSHSRVCTTSALP